MSESLGHKAATGAMWASVDRFGTMILQFVVNLILARLLLPSDFGAIGMLAIFIVVSQTLIDSGFGSALIQKKNPTQTDYSTIFYWNLTFSIFLYIILFLSSSAIARFYHMPSLSSVLKVIGLSLIINGVVTIQRNRLQKALAFKQLSFTNLGSYIIGALLAIWMGYSGYGVWSLVAMQLFGGIASIVILWLISRWHPSICFSTRSMKELFSFGGFMMAANILQTICQNLQGIIIGKKFSATQMGYYSQAYRFDAVTSQALPQVIVQVMYPVYSSIQDDREKLIEILSMNIRVISFLIFPLMGLLILIAEPLIFLLYGAKWLPCVPYFQIFCVGGFFVCLQNVNFYAVAAIGKSKTLFYWSFYKWGFLLTALLVGMNLGMYGILWGMVLSSVNIYIVNAALVAKNVGLSLLRQISFLIPIFIGTVISLLVGKLINIEFWHSFCQSIVYLSVYLCFCFFAKLKAIDETKILFQRLINRK